MTLSVTIAFMYMQISVNIAGATPNKKAATHMIMQLKAKMTPPMLSE